MEESDENVSLNFFPDIEQLISQQKAIVSKVQKYIIFEEDAVDETPPVDADPTTPTIRLYQEVCSLKMLIETRQIEQKIRKADINLDLTERDRMIGRKAVNHA